MIGDAIQHDNTSDAISGYDGVTGTGMIGDDGAYIDDIRRNGTSENDETWDDVGVCTCV